MKKFTRTRKLPCCLLLAGSILGGPMVPWLQADGPDRVGADAPHQERNAPANADKFRLPGSQVPVVSVTQSPNDGETDIKIRKSTAGAAPAKTSRRSRARKANAKVAAQAKTETKQTDAAAAAKPKEVSAPDIDDQRVGNSAPHQERSSDPNAHAARLFIWDR